MSTTLKILMPTAEEEAQINAGILSDPDSFVFSEKALQALQPTVKILPEIVAAYQRGDFKQTPQILKSNKENQINIQLNPLDMRFMKTKAQETGIHFQAIIEALVHNYAIGKIKLDI